MKKTALMIALIMLFGISFSKAQTSADEDKIYSFVEMKNPPKFPGGMPAFYKFLGENIKYPNRPKKKIYREPYFFLF